MTGCVVSDPGEAEGADIAVFVRDGCTVPDFAGRGRGIIYVQGEQIRTVSEPEMLDALYEESVKFAARVERGEATLSGAKVNIKPPDPLPRKADGSIPISVVRG